MSLVKGILQDKKQKELKAEYKLVMQQKTKEYRDYYNSSESYPESIIDVCHNVIILRGDSMMDERKVYVKNNKIQQVVWGN